MRVLHIGRFYPPFSGGIENFLGDLLTAQKKIGIQAGALVHDHIRATFPAKKAGFQGTRLVQSFSKLNIWRVPYHGNLLYTPISPKFPFWLNRVVGEFKPDILHFHLPNASAFWAMFLPKLRNIPWVVHWHADMAPSGIDRKLLVVSQFYRPFEQRLLSSCGTIIATSVPYFESSRALARWQEKIEIVPLGIDPARLHFPHNNLRQWADNLWGKANFKVLAVGKLTYCKGYEVLIRAAAGLDKVKVLIVGDGEQRHKLEKLIFSLGLGNKVLLLGGRSEQELNALRAGCDCLSLPSLDRTEPFGLALLEAMRYGKPVVASDIPGSGVGWVVTGNETGLLVRPGDVNELTEGLRKLQENPTMRQQMGKAGAVRFNKHFHIQHIAPKIKEIYDSLITRVRF